MFFGRKEPRENLSCCLRSLLLCGIAPANPDALKRVGVPRDREGRDRFFCSDVAGNANRALRANSDTSAAYYDVRWVGCKFEQASTAVSESKTAGATQHLTPITIAGLSGFDIGIYLAAVRGGWSVDLSAAGGSPEPPGIGPRFWVYCCTPRIMSI